MSDDKPDALKPDRRNPPPTISLDGGKLFLAPASVSGTRGAILPTNPSEHVPHILGHLDLPAADRPSKNKDREYLPSEKVEWVLTAGFSGKPKLDPKAVAFAFDKGWRERYGGFVGYGRDAATGRWTYLLSGNGPAEVTDVKLAWKFGRSNGEPSEQIFQDRISEVQKKLAGFGNCTLEPSLAPASAAPRAKALIALKQEFGFSVALKLNAPTGKPYDGKVVWDVMLCLGLKWGDMDCFHWENHGGFGDQYFFSVQTSTPPGYFLPEHVAAGQMNPSDLVFVFSVPRSAAPLQVFRAVVRGLEYCRTRLGGTISNSRGSSPNIPAIEHDLTKIQQDLASLGFPPGSHDALRFF